MEPLTRIAYRDANGQPRTQSTLRRESLVDHENFLVPWGRAHGAALHSPGVADGLRVRAVQGATGLRVLPGVALSASGDQLVLAPGGWAKFRGGRVAVADDGVPLPTAGLEGRHVLTVVEGEVPDDRVLDGESRKVVEHTPELILRPATGTAPSSDEVVLADVTFAAGVVTALGVGARRHCEGELALMRPAPSGSGSDLVAGDEPAVQLRPAGSGLEITADALTVRGRAGPTTLAIDAAAGHLGVGTAAPRARLDVAGAIAVDGLQALAGGAGQLRLNPSGEFANGVHSPGRLSVGSVNVGGADAGADPGAGNVAVGGRIGIGTANPQAPLDVRGDARVAGGLAAGSLTVQGAFTLTGALTVGQINSSGPLSVTGGVKVTGGSLDADRGLRVTGDSSVRGTLTVDGLASPTGSVTALGGLGTDGSLNVAGNAFIGSTIAAFNVDATAISARDPEAGRRPLVGTAGTEGVEDTAGIGVYGIGLGPRSNGVRGEANTGADAFAIWGVSTEGYAGYFDGRVNITGQLTYPSTAGMRIDHPLDPENKVLSHSSVESPDMLNIYCGTVDTDGDGTATVRLPDYFTALNEEFTYQLTVIGEPASAAVIDEIADDNAFTIRSSAPNLRVSWHVTGVRKDQFAVQNRVPVEASKPHVVARESRKQ